MLASVIFAMTYCVKYNSCFFFFVKMKKKPQKRLVFFKFPRACPTLGSKSTNATHERFGTPDLSPLIGVV